MLPGKPLSSTQSTEQEWLRAVQPQQHQRWEPARSFPGHPHHWNLPGPPPCSGSVTVLRSLGRALYAPHQQHLLTRKSLRPAQRLLKVKDRTAAAKFCQMISAQISLATIQGNALSVHIARGITAQHRHEAADVCFTITNAPHGNGAYEFLGLGGIFFGPSLQPR